MKRSRRVIRFGLLMVLGGALVTVAIAEKIGISGVISTRSAGPARFVQVGDKCIEGSVTTGTGWCCVIWLVVEPRVAAWNQGMLNTDRSVFDRLPTPLHPDYDPPESFPRWSRLWQPAHWPGMKSGGTIDWGQSATEVGVGWPLPAMAIDQNIAGTDRYSGGAPPEKSSRASFRFVSWRPIFSGFVVDTLLWSACLAVMTWCVRLVVRARRRPRWQCPVCRYDLRGLAPGAVCPECGGAGAEVKM